MNSDAQKSEIHRATEDAATSPSRDVLPGGDHPAPVKGLSPERPADQAPGVEILRDESDAGGPIHVRIDDRA